MDNLKDYSNISFKGAEQTHETSYLTFVSILSMKMNKKNAAWKINGKMKQRLPSLYRYVENFFAGSRQSQGNKQEHSESKNMALANHFRTLFSFSSPRLSILKA